MIMDYLSFRPLLTLGRVALVRTKQGQAFLGIVTGANFGGVVLRDPDGDSLSLRWTAIATVLTGQGIDDRHAAWAGDNETGAPPPALSEEEITRLAGEVA